MSQINKRLINNKIPKSYVFFGIFLFLFISLMVFVEIKNGKFETNDFKVYYQATLDFFSGNDPYSKSYGLSTGYFKYPPTTLYLFSPINFFNYFTAQIIHTFFLFSSLVIAIATLHRFLFALNPIKSSKGSFALLYIAFSLILIHVVREIHMGNVNLFLLVLFVLGISSFLESKLTLMVIFWSLMVIIKPIVILAFIPIIFYKMWKPILMMIGIGIIYFCLPIFHLGFQHTLELWKHWFSSVAQHGNYIISENSLKYYANHFFGMNSDWVPSIFVLVILLIIMIRDLIKQNYSKNEFVNWTIILMAFVPNFFVTDTEHFLLSLPLILIVLKQLLLQARPVFWIVFSFLTAFFSLKSNDLLGEKLTLFYNTNGLLGISNLCFIVLFLLLKNEQHKKLSLIDK